MEEYRLVDPNDTAESLNKWLFGVSSDGDIKTNGVGNELTCDYNFDQDNEDCVFISERLYKWKWKDNEEVGEFKSIIYWIQLGGFKGIESTCCRIEGNFCLRYGISQSRVHKLPLYIVGILPNKEDMTQWCFERALWIKSELESKCSNIPVHFYHCNSTVDILTLFANLTRENSTKLVITSELFLKPGQDLLKKVSRVSKSNFVTLDCTNKFPIRKYPAKLSASSFKEKYDEFVNGNQNNDLLFFHPLVLKMNVQPMSCKFLQNKKFQMMLSNGTYKDFSKYTNSKTGRRLGVCFFADPAMDFACYESFHDNIKLMESRDKNVDLFLLGDLILKNKNVFWDDQWNLINSEILKQQPIEDSKIEYWIQKLPYSQSIVFSLLEKLMVGGCSPDIYQKVGCRTKSL